MNNEVIIRSAVHKDINAMVILLDELFRIEADFQSDPERQSRGLKLLLDGCMKHKCIQVAEVENCVVGMCTAQLLISTAQGTVVALVEDMIVAPEFRRMGIGRNLIQAIAYWASEHGASRLQLLADKTNFPALEFYKKLGWELTQLICLRHLPS